MKSDGCSTPHESLEHLLWATCKMLQERMASESVFFERAGIVSYGARVWVAKGLVNWK